MKISMNSNVGNGKSGIDFSKMVLIQEVITIASTATWTTDKDYKYLIIATDFNKNNENETFAPQNYVFYYFDGMASNTWYLRNYIMKNVPQNTTFTLRVNNNAKMIIYGY